jgi:hypothetical protein
LEETSDLTNMLDVFLQYLAVDQDIIKVCFVENIEVWAKGLFDILLECYRYICESKGYDQRFKQAIVNAYGGLQENIISNPDKAICMANVNVGDIFCFG